jgi:hypothetical protein
MGAHGGHTLFSSCMVLSMPHKRLLVATINVYLPSRSKQLLPLCVQVCGG